MGAIMAVGPDKIPMIGGGVGQRLLPRELTVRPYQPTPLHPSSKLMPSSPLVYCAELGYPQPHPADRDQN